MAAAADLFIVDFLLRPFAKIWEKMPHIEMLLLIVLYGIIGYIVYRSAFKHEEHYHH